MAGADKIKEKILADARRQADGNADAARRDAEIIVHKARDEARRRGEGLLAKADKEAAARERRLVSVAELEGRKAKLATKQGLIDELFAKSIEKLNKLPDAQYERLLVGMIALSAAGDEEVILSPKDAGRVSAGFIGAANKALAAKGKPAALVISKDSRDIDGGFVLRSGDVEVNNSFASIVKFQKDSLDALAVKMLF
ncbi:MAG: hypothetical protein LBJ10_04940 [Clostridiales bacterium]|jgi:V/A-type H+-transporting ATPase subunit E|nr:hypothetical protein [Clostridiales bacterium]